SGGVRFVAGRSIGSPRPACPRFTAAPPRRCSPTGPALPPETFFSGPGLDRADPVRSQPDRLAELCAQEDARQLVWAEGLPALDSDGRLVWGQISEATLFLGLDGDPPLFASLPSQPPPVPAFALLAT